MDSGQADDEIVRNFYLLNVRKWIAVSLEEIESIDQEMEILTRMDVLKQVPGFEDVTNAIHSPMSHLKEYGFLIRCIFSMCRVRQSHYTLKGLP